MRAANGLVTWVILVSSESRPASEAGVYKVGHRVYGDLGYGLPLEAAS